MVTGLSLADLAEETMIILPALWLPRGTGGSDHGSCRWKVIGWWLICGSVKVDHMAGWCLKRITLALWINDPQAPPEGDRVTNYGSRWKMELSEFGGMTGWRIMGRCPESLRLEWQDDGAWSKTKVWWDMSPGVDVWPNRCGEDRAEVRRWSPGSSHRFQPSPEALGCHQKDKIVGTSGWSEVPLEG